MTTNAVLLIVFVIWSVWMFVDGFRENHNKDKT